MSLVIVYTIFMDSVGPSFFNSDTCSVANSLVGRELVFSSEKGLVGGVISEVEAYTQEDPACHAYNGKRTKRNTVMFKAPGTLYVYFIYGMYYCLNIVTEPAGRGCAVLIRSIIPTIGIDIMKANRDPCREHNLCNGPAKLVQALGITMRLNGVMIDKSGIAIGSLCMDGTVIEKPRVGISSGEELLWRYTLK